MSAYEISVGLDHELSEHTKAYLAFAYTHNEETATNGVTGGGHGATVTPVAGEDSQGISVGIIHHW